MQAEEGAPQFWAFVEAWAGRGGGGVLAAESPPPLDEDCWGQILAAATPHTSPSLARLLPVVLASRKYSPRLEVFNTLATDSSPPPQVCFCATSGLSQQP